MGCRLTDVVNWMGRLRTDQFLEASDNSRVPIAALTSYIPILQHLCRLTIVVAISPWSLQSEWAPVCSLVQKTLVQAQRGVFPCPPLSPLLSPHVCALQSQFFFFLFSQSYPSQSSSSSFSILIHLVQHFRQTESSPALCTLFRLALLLLVLNGTCL